MNKLSKSLYAIEEIFNGITDRVLRKKIIDAYEDINRIDNDLHSQCKWPTVISVAPAGKTQHHYWYNGLFQHFLEMWRLGNIFYNKVSKYSDQDYDLSDIAVCILLHDFSKGVAFEFASDPVITAKEDLRFIYRQNFFSQLNYDHRTAFLMAHYGIRLSDQQYIGIMHTEGGWGDLSKARLDGNMLSKMMHVLDLTSSQLCGGKYIEPNKKIKTSNEPLLVVYED